MSMAEGTPPRLGAVLWRAGGLMHSLTAQEIRLHGAGVMGLVSALSLPLLACAFFYVVFEFIGQAGLAPRGDVITFLLTGIFVFFLAARTQARVRTDWARNPLLALSHPVLRAWAGAASVLYVTLTAMVTVYLGNYLIAGVAEMHDPAGVVAPLALTWLFATGAGLCISGVARRIGGRETMNMTFARVMFVTCGMFFSANAVPGWMRPYFDWNPLFHTIDQLRDAVFVNYVAHHTGLAYPAAATFALLVLGHMLTFGGRDRG